MQIELSRKGLRKLPGLIADMDVGRAARDAAELAATQAAVLSQVPQTRARDALSSARRQAATRSRDLRSLRLTTEPPQARNDARLVIGVLLGFFAGLTVMFVLQRRAGARRRERQARIDDRLAGVTPEDAGQELVGVMGLDQEHDGSSPIETPAQTAETPAEADAERDRVPA